MRGPGDKLTRKQEVGIYTQLTIPTIVDAADSASISEATLWRWFQREDFQTAYRQARREAVLQTVAFLQRVVDGSIDTLSTSTRHRDASPRGLSMEGSDGAADVRQNAAKAHI